MPVGQPTTSTPMYLGSIITCDPTQRIVEVALNASGQRLQIMTTPVCARWPMVGETWTVCFVNGTPFLGEPYQTYQVGSNSLRTGIEEIPAGDAWIHSPTGVVHIIGSDDGSTDFVLSKSSLASITSAAWITPTLLNSWTNFGGGYETAGYLKDPLGFVHLKGVIHGGATSTVAFTLPPGYRPGGTLFVAGTNNANTAASVQPAPAGTVTITLATAGAAVGLLIPPFLAEN